MTKNKCWVVAIVDYDEYSICSINRSYKGAVKLWENAIESRIKEEWDAITYYLVVGSEGYVEDFSERMLSDANAQIMLLRAATPENVPFDIFRRPIIQEFDLDD